MKKLLLMVAELALVVSGVFVFRGLWTLLDSVPLMQTTAALWLSLVAGLAVSLWALWFIQKHDAG